MRFLLALGFALLTLPGAHAVTRADCDKIDNPMLFNRCLASLAPEQQPRVRSGRGSDTRSIRRSGSREAAQTNPVKSIGGGRKRLELPAR